MRAKKPLLRKMPLRKKSLKSALKLPLKLRAKQPSLFRKVNLAQAGGRLISSPFLEFRIEKHG